MRLRNIPRASEVIENSSYVIHDPAKMQGHWRSVFENGRPLHLEVGMGKGQFLLRMSEQNPDINYVGIERYTSVLLRAVEKIQARERGPENLRFLCTDARELQDIFAPGEVSRIYLNFSDPWPKDRHKDRRLVSGRFLERYERILTPGGLVEFKTDNQGLFEFALEEARNAGWETVLCTRDLHADEDLMRTNVMTEYEEKFSGKGNPICKMMIRKEKRAQAEPTVIDRA